MTSSKYWSLFLQIAAITLMKSTQYCSKKKLPIKSPTPIDMYHLTCRKCFFFAKVKVDIFYHKKAVKLLKHSFTSLCRKNLNISGGSQAKLGTLLNFLVI